MTTLQQALQAIGPLKRAPAPLKPAKGPKPAPRRDRSASAPTGSLPRVAAGSFDCGRREVYGSKGAHSESREPPTHEYFPERFFAGPLYDNTPRWYPYIIHKTL